MSNIQKLQRIGRTGRKRDGYVEVLLSEGREEKNWQTAIQQYEDVQQSIVKGRDLELYADVERLLPDDARPKCVETVMEIIPYEREEKTRTTSGTKSKQAHTRQKTLPEYRKRGRPAKEEEDGSPKKKKKFIQSDSDEEIKFPRRSVSAPKPNSKNAKPSTFTSARTAAPVSGFRSAREVAQFPDEDDQAEVSDDLDQLPQGKSKTKPPIPHHSKRLTNNANPALEAEARDAARKKLLSWLVDSDGEAEEKSQQKNSKKNAVIELSDSELDVDKEQPPKNKTKPASPIHANALSPLISSSSSPSVVLVRPARRKPRPNPDDLDIVVIGQSRSTNDNQDRIMMPPPPVPRRNSPTSVPTAHHRRRVPKPSILDNKNQFLEIEAIHSGDEVDAGSSDSEGIETESDRQFAGDFSATQVESDYDQSGIYRQGLLTQVPSGGPSFASKPVRRGVFGRGASSPSRRPVVSSSPPQDVDEDLDHYSLGSFVVEDDDNILEVSSQELSQSFD